MLKVRRAERPQNQKKIVKTEKPFSGVHRCSRGNSHITKKRVKKKRGSGGGTHFFFHHAAWGGAQKKGIRGGTSLDRERKE